MFRSRRAAGDSASLASGEHAEREAERFLMDQGLQLRERNYRCKLGEIDLIMGDGSSCVFVEVRYRKQLRFGSPAETVNHGKQTRLQRAAQHFLQSKGLLDKIPCRFDVVSIAGSSGDRKIDWIKNAF
jgi:putative endonuclease